MFKWTSLAIYLIEFLERTILGRSSDSTHCSHIISAVFGGVLASNELKLVA
jgi:hypothetical protein